ncbi:MAG: DegT/DnrJ/EryC1/StrS family aminotransferase, partial [Candidatus Woesearchaeota archaeon]
IADKMRMLADHGRIDKYEHKFEGHNYRLDTLHAAIIRVMLNHLDEWVIERRRKAELYNELLQGLDIEMPEERAYNKHSYYMYVIKTQKRNELMEHLKNKGVSTGIHYPIPLHMQPAYKYIGHKEGDFPVSENCAKSILSLPLYPELTDEEMYYVVENIKSFYAAKL